jgi:hypothetical protein
LFCGKKFQPIEDISFGGSKLAAYATSSGWRDGVAWELTEAPPRCGGPLDAGFLEKIAFAFVVQRIVEILPPLVGADQVAGEWHRLGFSVWISLIFWRSAPAKASQRRV